MMEAFLQQLSAYGVGPVLLVVIFLLGWVVRELKENGKKNEARAKELQAAMTAEMNAMAKRFDEHLAATDKKVEDLRTRVSCVERDYLPRDEHYKEFSGWRAEIQEVRNLIISLFRDQAKQGEK
jgi:ABC-type transport system involved in cytochrome bd biosynthesis fused ATPase/permease subunit